MDDKKQRVFARHPLHYIANITYYEDTYSKHMVALRLAQLQGQPQAAGSNELVIYECTDEVSIIHLNIESCMQYNYVTINHSVSSRVYREGWNVSNYSCSGSQLLYPLTAIHLCIFSWNNLTQQSFVLPQTQAKDICLTLAQAFEAVHNKMKFEQNLPRSELR